MPPSMQGVELDGVGIAWRATGVVGAALERLLGGLPPRRSAVRWTFAAATRGAATNGAGPAWAPWFFHGKVQVSRSGPRVLVSDGETEVVLDGDAIEVWTTARAPSDGVVLVLRVALFTALRALGRFELHAGAVIARERGLLVVGDSGAGKSTTVLALVAAGAEPLGDDTVLVRARLEDDVEGADVVAVSFPREFFVSERTLHAHPALASHARIATAHDDKRAIDPTRALGVALRTHAPPDAILCPRVTAAATSTLHALTPADAFGHLVSASAVVAVEGIARRDEQLAVLRALARRPAFDLALGGDVLAAPRQAGAAILAEIARRVGGLG